MSTIVASRNIVKKFGAKIALNAISFDIKEGELCILQVLFLLILFNYYIEISSGTSLPA